MASSARVDQRPAISCDAKEAVDDLAEPTDLNLLKEVSQRLKLATRRSSTVQWKQVIEFRKSMGFYSSDVEPEFLDKIVEAKMKSDAQNSPSPKPISPLLSGEVPRQESPKTKRVQSDDNNNNLTPKSPRKWRSKSERSPLENNETAHKKNGISLLGFHFKRDVSLAKNTKSKVSKKTEKVTEVTVNASQVELTSTANVESTTEDRTTHCDGDITVKTEYEGGEEKTKKTSKFPLGDSDDETDDDTTGMSEMAIRYRNINRALGKIRTKLIIMRMDDNKLARKLLDVRSEMNLVKVRQSCDAHAEMLDDVTYELEEEDMLPGLIKACDLPSRPPGSLLSAFSSLRNIGVSRMNINRRRFSIR